MAQARCPSIKDFCALRLSRLDATGDLDESSEGASVLGPISLESSPQVSEGESFEQKNGCGTVCASAEDDDAINRWDLTLQLCETDWEAWELMTGGDLITSAGNTIGHADADSADAPPFGTAVEGWAKAWDGDHQYAVGGSSLYIVDVWPRVRWTRGDETLENGFRVITFNGKATGNPTAGTGPDADWPIVPQGIHMAFESTEIPTVVCGTIALAS